MQTYIKEHQIQYHQTSQFAYIQKKLLYISFTPMQNQYIQNSFSLKFAIHTISIIFRN